MDAGAPEGADARARERARDIVEKALGDLLQPGGLRVSPLGAAWSSDIDAHVTALPPAERLRALGWLPLDGLLARVGSRGGGRWLVVDDHEPLAAVDLTTAPLPEPVGAILARCRRRGEVGRREVLELRALAEAGHALPGDEPVLARSLAPGATLPVPWGRGELRRRAGRARARLRPRVGVALSGVDGAGKSTLAAGLAEALGRAGVPVSHVWTRPGMRIGFLRSVGSAVKRVLGEDPDPGIRTVAKGASGDVPRSRQGVVGWTWCLLVTVSFLVDVRRRHLLARGVVIHDRHLLDALATLRFGYAGVDTRVHETLVRRFIPKVLVTFYLDTTAEMATARKQDPLFGAYAVERQLELYVAGLERVPDLHVLDASRSPDELKLEAVAELTRRAGR